MSPTYAKKNKPYDEVLGAAQFAMHMYKKQ